MDLYSNAVFVSAAGRLPGHYFGEIPYTLGETIDLAMRYRPNGLSAASPGTAEYFVGYHGLNYASGPQQFFPDLAHPAAWGILDDAQVGGYMLVQFDGGPATTLRSEWTNISFQLDNVAVRATTWSLVRSLYR